MITSCGYRSEDPNDQSPDGSEAMIPGTRAASSDESTAPIEHRSMRGPRGDTAMGGGRFGLSVDVNPNARATGTTRVLGRPVIKQERAQRGSGCCT